jgi:hypothetical protein
VLVLNEIVLVLDSGVSFEFEYEYEYVGKLGATASVWG